MDKEKKRWEKEIILTESAQADCRNGSPPNHPLNRCRCVDVLMVVLSLLVMLQMQSIVNDIKKLQEKTYHKVKGD